MDANNDTLLNCGSGPIMPVKGRLGNGDVRNITKERKGRKTKRKDR